MSRPQLQKGFAIIEVMMVVIVLAIIAFAAWRVIDATGTVDEVANQTNSTTTSTGTAVPVVTKASDLKKLKAMLDAIKIDDNASATLVSQSTF